VTRPARIVAGFLIGVSALVLLIFAINLPWFDEALAPELVALRDSKVEFSGDNAYPELVKMRDDTTAVPALSSFACDVRRYPDCADRIVAETLTTDWQSADLAAVFDRYNALLGHAHYIETREAHAREPVWPNALIIKVAQLRRARAYHLDANPEFLKKIAADLGFWTMVLREGESIQIKMVSLAEIQKDLAFISKRLREKTLEPSDAEFLRDFLRAFTPEESNVGAGLLAETRIDLQMDEPYIAERAPWLTRPLVQKNATLNLGYHEIVVPMLARAALGPREWYEHKAVEPIRYQARVSPRTLFNLGGKLAWSRSEWDPWQFPARVHDVNGRILLVLLQAEIAQLADVAPVVVTRESKHRNPYTGEPFEYDAQAGTLWFKCQETAYHPPEPPPLCAMAIRRPAY
jgi:hypothetical protein